MVVSLRPELQKMVEEKVKAGLFPSAEALINVAVEQVVSGDHLDPGEMERLLAVGKADVRAGRFVDFKSFPVQDDHHLLTVLRYVEANAFRSGIVECAQDWPFCSAAARQNHLPFPLTPWPIDRPADWLELLNQPPEDSTLQHLRRSAARGRPFGDPSWV